MRFGFASRMRIKVSRPLVRMVQQSSALRAPLLARRAADLAKGLDPDTALMLVLGEISGDAKLAEGTPAAARRKMAESIAIVEDVPVGDLDVTESEVSGSAGPIAARVYRPTSLAAPSPGLVYVHGGGWVTGDLDTHDTLCRRIALVGDLCVISIAPRMAPEHPFPAAIDDTVAAFRDVAGRAEELRLDPARIGIGGDSAGGNLSAIVGLETRSDERKPALTALLYPCVDATCRDPSHQSLGQGYLLTADSIAWYLEHYVGEDASRRKLPRVSPMYVDDLSGAPPALVVNAGFDPLRDEAERYWERLKAAGTPAELVRYPALIHGFLLMTGLSAAALAATEEIARRMGKMLREKKTS